MNMEPIIKFMAYIGQLVLEYWIPVGILTVISTVIAWIRRWFRSKKQKTLVVFYPQPYDATDNSMKTDMPFHQDGERQWIGFEKGLRNSLFKQCHEVAREDRKKYQNKNGETIFFIPIKHTEKDDLLMKMQKYHENENANYFIVTMSSVVEAVSGPFKDWRKSLKGKNAPILITTVTSNQDVADITNGIIRWYVRSEEEIDLLAVHFAWKLNCKRIIVFFKGTYGRNAADRFKAVFEHIRSSGNLSTELREINGREDSYKIEATANAPVGALVIAYGDTLKTTIEKIVAKGFLGPITCTSTLTEEAWQPWNEKTKNSQIAVGGVKQQRDLVDKRIFTVMYRKKDKSLPDSIDQDVVSYFSKQVIMITIRFLSETKTTLDFLKKWMHKERSDGKDMDYWPVEKQTGLDMEVLADGDVAVQLMILGDGEWRQQRP